MSAMKRLFQIMSDKKASDIFMSVGAPINIKINGVAVPVNQTVMTADTVRQLLYEVLNERQIKEYEEEMELNTAYVMEGVGAFRISAMRQKGSPAVVVRFIPNSIPALDSLGLPEALKDVIMQKRGLVLMVGATGSGKSTSLAAMLDYRNGKASGHILTLEDPVEFIFSNKKSIVNQREVGTDTKAFEVALKNALRQAPDCILIGEIRDKQTMGMALAYAQSGHLCLATLHANNSYHAMNRIINFYPLENRPALLLDLAAALQAVISQRLVRTKTGARVAAVCDAFPDKVEQAHAKAEALRRKHHPDAPEVVKFNRYQDLIESGAVDAVLIATPHFQHPEICIAAFARGVHVLSEKPLAVHVKDARAAIAAHAKAPRPTQFSKPFHPRIPRISTNSR